MKYIIILTFCLSWGAIAAPADQVIHYEAAYMGIPLLDMTLTWVEDETSVQITYDNQLKPFIAFFHPIHNIYRVHFQRDSFAPLDWSKTVSEGDMQFQLRAVRSSDGQKVIYSNGLSLDFPPGCMTIFSATHFLASRAQDPGFFPVKFPVFIDGELWEAHARRYTADNPHPDHTLVANQILVQADLHYLSGKAIIDDNDILTSVIATEGTRFLLWVAPDGNYTRAQFGNFPRAVVLKQIQNK
ncbi:MAG: DUF3108 domain-containing protein [Candidatus Marinimicrobia bacterium]|nr:DUF3108 domain-containing protein [Candidatus Neomarinimicrobiota bacterium]